jgi:hypothetical protein
MGLRDMDVRIDGLGSCFHTKNITEGVSLDVGENEDNLSDYQAKKHVLSKYMFNLGMLIVSRYYYQFICSRSPLFYIVPFFCCHSPDSFTTLSSLL